MGNRAIITLENAKRQQHPVALYVHWNGGLESVLAFVEYTWATFERGRDDLFTFHARLCQVLGNWFPDGLSLYAYTSEKADELGTGCDNGRFHLTVSVDGVKLKGRAEEVRRARRHEYWQGEQTIMRTIAEHMPKAKEEAAA
ncbi:hypothetical protein [uncultured Hyphomicrobium sp.]|uniref:hypothetical protein n=1 Tax=uncultured Hyphomicrobium sp. TaxID=194373 RepID=UPI0025EDDCD9|nr:hypothetical protein [uncultured Hyphomicrobium sp.]